MTSSRLLVLTGSSGALAVLLGAFGAHVLRERLTAEMLDVFEKASRYHFYHTFALGLCALLAARGIALRAAPICFCAGIALFSGSLYAMSLTEQRWLGAVTPFGGVLMVAGWIALAAAARRTSPAPPG